MPGVGRNPVHLHDDELSRKESSVTPRALVMGAAILAVGCTPDVTPVQKALEASARDCKVEAPCKVRMESLLPWEWQSLTYYPYSLSENAGCTNDEIWSGGARDVIVVLNKGTKRCFVMKADVERALDRGVTFAYAESGPLVEVRLVRGPGELDVQRISLPDGGSHLVFLVPQ